MKIFGRLILFVCCLASGYLLYLYQHREFSPIQQEHSLLFGGEKTPELRVEDQHEVQRILSQPFVYLDLGKQMTAYVSQDGKYVLKLFHPRIPIQASCFHSFHKLQRLFSMKWFSSAFLHRKERLLRLYERYELGFREMKEEAGLVYVHLSPTDWLEQTVEIKDKDRTYYFVDLQKTPFVLQIKAELALARFERLIRANDLEGISASVEQLRDLFRSRAHKGITDRIQTLHNNYGFVGEKAIQIDLGRVRLDESTALEPDKELARIMQGIENMYPQVSLK